jgi:hypothetical protein
LPPRNEHPQCVAHDPDIYKRPPDGPEITFVSRSKNISFSRCLSENAHRFLTHDLKDAVHLNFGVCGVSQATWKDSVQSTFRAKNVELPPPRGRGDIVLGQKFLAATPTKRLVSGQKLLTLCCGLGCQEWLRKQCLAATT